MNEIIIYGEPPRRRRPWLRLAVAAACFMAVIIGSGYAGAMIALRSMPQPTEPTIIEITQSHIPWQAGTEGSFEHIRNPAINMGELSLPDLFDGANPAVVAISTEVTGRNVFGATVTRPSAGSGFFISPDGHIMTNDHVIENAANISVLLYDGRRLPATIIGRDPASDLAVIKVEGRDWQHLSFANSEDLRVGEQVAVIGNPLGELANSLTVGHISALDREVSIDRITRVKLQTDAAVNRGNSGGPMLNLRGEVIGVVSAKSSGTGIEGLGFAIPSSQAARIAEQLIEHGFVRGRALLGINVSDSDGQVRIMHVSPDTAADTAGLQQGDIIVSINGTEITTFPELRAKLDEASPGEEMRLRINRNGRVFDVTAVLDEHRPQI